MLVNNAGFGARSDVAALDLAPQLGMIDVNCRALVALSHAVLPQMIAQSARITPRGIARRITGAIQKARQPS